MRHWIIAVFAVLLLFAGSVEATVSASDFEVGSGVPAIANLQSRYDGACARFSWTAGSGVDFNNFIVTVTSNNSNFGLDLNLSTNTYNACTILPGEWVQIVIYRIDGNADGFFIGAGDSAIVNPGTVTQAGTHLMFNLLSALGGLAAVVVLGAVMVIFFKRMQMKANFKL